MSKSSSTSDFGISFNDFLNRSSIVNEFESGFNSITFSVTSPILFIKSREVLKILRWGFFSYKLARKSRSASPSFLRQSSTLSMIISTFLSYKYPKILAVYSSELSYNLASTLVISLSFLARVRAIDKESPLTSSSGSWSSPDLRALLMQSPRNKYIYWINREV